MAPRLKRTRRLSPWRKMALATWGDPNDPTVYGTLELDAGPALAFIARERAAHGVKVTITHLVGRALARAIAAEPAVNGRVSWGRLLQRETVDIFFQVATEGGQDLSGAKVSDVDRKPAVDVARELADKAARIRARRDPAFGRSRRLMDHLPTTAVRWALGISDLLVNHLDLDLHRLGFPRDPFGSAMVTNVGSFDLEAGFVPILPLARTPILILVGAVRDKPVAVAGRVEIQPRLTLCATFDHRVMDGFQAGRLARTIREYFADPSQWR